MGRLAARKDRVLEAATPAMVWGTLQAMALACRTLPMSFDEPGRCAEPFRRAGLEVTT